MARRKSAAIPPPPRKTLLEWIELDDGNTTSTGQPRCSGEEQTFHRQIFVHATHGGGEDPEPIYPPRGLRLPPLG